MGEREIYEKVLSQIAKNKISDAQLLLENTESLHNLELLGLLSSIKGEFEKAYDIFFKLAKRKKEKNIMEYLEYYEKTIITEYIPLYNKLILEIKQGTDSNCEEMIEKLEKIFKNTELYSLAVLFFLNKKNKVRAKEYYEKLKLLDSSDTVLSKVDFYFDKKKSNKKILFIYGILGITIISLGGVSYKNNFLKEVINKKDFESYQIQESKDKEIELLNMKLTEKESSKIIEVEEKILPQEKEVEIFWNENEIYNLALKRINQNKYEDAIKIFDLIIQNQLPEYKKREIIFQKAQAYNKLKNKEKALESYNEYIKNSGKKEYEIYKEIVKKNIEKLNKEME